MSQRKIRPSQNLFLPSRAPAQPRKPLPFFQDLHQEVSRSWKQTFSARISNPPAADFAIVSNMAEHGYAVMAVVEEILAAHLTPNSALTSHDPCCRPCRAGLLPLQSGNLTWKMYRRQPFSILGLYSKLIKKMCLRSWIREKA